jgi:hypothetical protein
MTRALARSRGLHEENRGVYEGGMSTLSEAIERRLQAIHRQYDSHFAGQARVTRDPGLLDAMLEELAGVAPELEGLSEEERAPLSDLLAERRALYEGEAQSIRETLADPEALEAHRVQTWVEVNRWRYDRHFAGHNRLSRDLGLLAEMTEDLARAEREYSELSAGAGDGPDQQRGFVRDQLVLYGRERAAITSGRAEATLESQAGAMAQMANDCFQVYRAHFAGKSRISRRPALLERVVGTLEDAKTTMEALRASGLEDEQLEKNLEVVGTNLQQYTSELDAVRRAKSESRIGALIEALADTANGLFAEYQEHFAGQQRTTRDRDLLARIIEGLYDIGRQMEDLQKLGELQANTQNLRIVLDRLRVYLREDEQVAGAQRGSD